mmetsp:Transcript_2871/g.10915  ORF Transcript_2871/g.10915 Transcript_2871/m.10915 type:complete len:480 (-) Transcript_2871:101-1540(-)
MSKLMTCWMSGKSRPLAATSVATNTSWRPCLNASTAALRSRWSFAPWIAAASTPLSSRYSWMSSTSCLRSQNTTTGGAVFWRHSSRYTTRASCLTYSTSWMTSRFAAPARETFTTTGLTSVDRAKSRTFCGIVAENNNVCRMATASSWLFFAAAVPLGPYCPSVAAAAACSAWASKRLTILRTSSSNPVSSMRSPSSRQKYWHRSKRRSRRSRKSMSRPGVATTPWTPRRRATSSCVRLSSPPTASVTRMRGTSPPAPRSRPIASAKCVSTSCVCRASSRDGQSTTPIGPCPARVGPCSSSTSRARTTSGRAKVTVLPDPVNAMPIMSLPDNATGMPWTWIGVGRLMPFALSASTNWGGSPIASNFLIGAGGSSPSTRMPHFSRMARDASADWCSDPAGGRQRVSSDFCTTRSAASSLADFNALICADAASRTSRSSSSLWRRASIDSSPNCRRISAACANSDFGAAGLASPGCSAPPP